MAAVSHNKYGGEGCLSWDSTKEDIVDKEAEFPILSPVMAAGNGGCSCGNKWSLFHGITPQNGSKMDLSDQN
jgi:hypothetical protein